MAGRLFDFFTLSLSHCWHYERCVLDDSIKNISLSGTSVVSHIHQYQLHLLNTLTSDTHKENVGL
jgi:hypothetical protein